MVSEIQIGNIVSRGVWVHCCLFDCLQFMLYTDQWGHSHSPNTSTSGQNTSSLSLFHGTTNMTGHSVKQLEFHELMKNHIFQELHQRWTVTTNTMVETTQTNSSLLKEIAELKAEVQRLKATEGCLL